MSNYWPDYANRDDAIQWDGTYDSAFYIEGWADEVNPDERMIFISRDENGCVELEVEDSAGRRQEAYPEDYIVDDGDGGFSTCKPDEFCPRVGEERIQWIVNWMSREIESRDKEIEALEKAYDELKKEIEELRSRDC